LRPGRGGAAASAVGPRMARRFGPASHACTSERRELLGHGLSATCLWATGRARAGLLGQMHSDVF
jgi:hypothetical protein